MLGTYVDAATVDNLWNFHANQGKLVEAEQMHQRALQINNLRNHLYADQGKLLEAEQMYYRALQGYEMVLESVNIIMYIPELDTLLNLGSLFKSQNNTAKARFMHSKALIGHETIFGPDLLKSRNLQD